jgi:DnaK suppressor protein
MSTIDTKRVRERLAEERRALEAELERLREDTSRSLEDATDEDGSDTHLGDSATETYDREVEMTLEESLQSRLGEVDAAFERLEEGSYGRCERCGRTIAAERLEALPYATKCIDCKRLEEHG